MTLLHSDIFACSLLINRPNRTNLLCPVELSQMWHSLQPPSTVRFCQLHAHQPLNYFIVGMSTWPHKHKSTEKMSQQCKWCLVPGHCEMANITYSLWGGGMCLKAGYPGWNAGSLSETVWRRGQKLKSWSLCSWWGWRQPWMHFRWPLL